MALFFYKILYILIYYYNIRFFYKIKKVIKNIRQSKYKKVDREI